jgi:tetratricopeptide (TPR) repeat protein
VKPMRRWLVQMSWVALLGGCSRVAPPTPPATPAPTQRPALTQRPTPTQPPAPTEAELQAALARDVGDVRAYEGLARLYYERSRTQRSYVLLARQVLVQGFAALARTGATSSDLLTTRGLLELADDRTDRAMTDFLAAVAVDHRDLRAQAALAATALRIRDFERAQPAFAFVVASSRGQRDPTAWMGLAMAEQGRGQFMAAEQALRRAAELAPSDPRPHFYLGRLTAHRARRDGTGEESAVMAHFNRARALAGGDARFADLVAEIEQRDHGRIFCICYYPVRNFCGTQEEHDAWLMEKRLTKAEEDAFRSRLLELERKAAADGADTDHSQ